MAMMNAVDFLIIGGGIVGTTLALALKDRHSDARIAVIDKEAALGLHASGRNSGVLHAGFYYTADSLKARFTADGNALLTRYCLEHGLPINRCGKIVVARREADLPSLDELHRRAEANGVDVARISAAEAREIEPRVRTVERALWSPTTASVDPVQVLGSLADDARRRGIEIRTGIAFRQRLATGVLTSGGAITAGYVVNAAGLHADRIAREFGFSRHHRLVPFKGLYLYSAEPAGALRTHVYPVPDLGYPFLGVHFTVTVDGHVKIGPTAIPALWREQYGGFDGFSLRDFVEVIGMESMLMLSNRFGFAALAWQESRKYLRTTMARLAAELVDGVRADQYRQWGRTGIRAQLVDVARRTLEMDFHFEGDDRSFHVLNAVSPAFTCSMAFSRFLVDEIDARRGIH